MLLPSIQLSALLVAPWFYTVALSAAEPVATTLSEQKEWNQFLGPNGDGIVQGKKMPIEWSDTKNVVWKQALDGRAWSSPVVHQGKIYLTNAKRHEEGLHEAHWVDLSVMALDGATGKLLWSKNVFKVMNPQSLGYHKKNSDASSSPIVQDDRIYAHFGHMGIVCLDLNGQEIWKSQEFTYKPVHGTGGSPVLFENLLIFNIDDATSGRVVALNKHDGKLAWESTREVKSERSFSFSTPTIIEQNGKALVVSPGSDVVSALDAHTGKSEWHFKFEGFSVVPKPNWANGLIYFSTGYNKASVHAFKPEGSGDISNKKVWSLQRGAPLTPSMLVLNQRIYMVADNGMVTCADALTGEIKWQERVGRNTSSSPMYANGLIYTQDELGVGHVLKHQDTFELVATNPLKEKTLSSYAVLDEDWIIRGENHLFRIGTGTQTTSANSQP